MRIAVDVNISNRDIGELAREGDVIVCVAHRGETDEAWVGRALDEGCEVFISQDLDIPNLLDLWKSDAMFFEKISAYRKWLKTKAK